MEEIIGILDLLEMKLGDVRLYCFGCHIEFLRLDDDVLSFLGFYDRTFKILDEVVVFTCQRNEGENLRE